MTREDIVKALVKGLVWESISDRTQEAVGFNATYRVQTMQDGSARWNSRYMGAWYGAESPSDAQAAAEADYRALIAAALHVEKIAGLVDLASDFSAAKIDALRYSPPYGASPEDEPDPVVDAETVWAWQADVKDALAAFRAAATGGEGG